MGFFRKHNPLGDSKNLTVIAVDTELKGSLNSIHTIQIDGIFEGILSSKTLVIVSETGKATGEIGAEEVYVYGKLIGKVDAEKVVIGEKGHVNATISAEHLVILEGGHYVGEKKERNNKPKKTDHNVQPEITDVAEVPENKHNQ